MPSFRPLPALLHGLASAGLALALACAGGAPQRPAREREVILTTPYQDEDVGQRAAEEVAAAVGLLESPELGAYVQRVGMRVARQIPNRSFEYRFLIVDQTTPNAFALPGGRIYVSRGLLALTSSEDELAGVLAHEITHAWRRHAAGRQTLIRTLNPFSLGYMRAATIAGYSRDQEREADRGGQELAARAGYDPGALVRLLRGLENVERLLAGTSRIPGFFDTHPATTERIATVASRARAMDWRPTPGIAPDPAAYLAQLDGLPIGPNPAEGVFQGSRFLHPDLDFTLRFPEGYALENTRQAVGGTAPRRDAQIFLELGGRGSDPSAAAQSFVESELAAAGVRVTRSQPMTIGGFPAHRVDGTARAPIGPLDGQITWIAYDGLIYRLTAVSRSATASTHLGLASGTARSFRPLTREERDSVRIDRVRIVPARAQETLDSLGRRAGNAWDLQRTAVLNGVFASTPLEPGQLVKIVVEEPYEPPVKVVVEDEVPYVAPDEGASEPDSSR